METRRTRTLPPARIRSIFLLEVASELMWMNEWPHRELRMTLREQGGEDWGPTFSGSDTPDAIAEVAAGTVHLGFLNPAAVLTLALNGKGPFAQPVPVRAVTVLQSYDQLVLAVSEKSGLTSLDDVKRLRYPLRVSLRGQRNHAVHSASDGWPRLQWLGRRASTASDDAFRCRRRQLHAKRAVRAGRGGPRSYRRWFYLRARIPS